MDRKEGFITVNAIIDGEEKTLFIPTNDLRNQIGSVSQQDEVVLQLQNNGECYEINTNTSLLKKLLKQYDLQTNKPVPKFLSNYLEDITLQFAKKSRLPIKGRDEELDKVWFYLSQKKKNNVFLVGDIDVGKTAIACEVIRQIATNECPKEFFNTRVLLLKPEAFFKLEKPFWCEHIASAIIKFLVANKNNVILYIDNGLYMKMDEYLNYIVRLCIIEYSIPVITTVRTEVFQEYFGKDFYLEKYQNIVQVVEPEIEEVQTMIEQRLKLFEKRYKVTIPDNIVKFGIFTSCLATTSLRNPGRTLEILERACMEARRKDKKTVDKSCVLSCYDSYMKLYNNISKEDRRKIAYHEAGHYLVLQKCSNIKDMKTACVSILPMMDFLGVNYPYHVLGKNVFYTREYMIDNIASYLGGRVAEEQITNEYSTGAGSDLKMANLLAEEMLIKYGFSEVDNKNRSYMINDYLIKDYLLTEKNKETLNQEIKKIIEESYERAKKIITDNRSTLDAIVEWLLEEEILTGEQLEEICDVYK